MIELAASPTAAFVVPSVTPNRFVGRETDLRDVCNLLHSASAWVTLCATGGAGKTRLALEVGQAMRDEFTDGVRIIECEPVTEPELLLPTLAAALEIVESSTVLEESVADFLRDKEILLILDNMEQVAAATMQLHTIIADAPRVRILATSRQPLNVPNEQVYQLDLLPTPDLRLLPDLSELAANPCVAIFVQRAQHVKPDFQLCPENAVAVAAICCRLEGVALAIELAASRIRQFPPQAMLTHLDQSLSVLRRGGRDKTERQQTLYGLIEWSYNLLSVGEQALFARLGSFAGGCTLAAAESVCVLDNDLSIAVSDGVAHLLEKNLLRRSYSKTGAPRYTMLRTIGEFARHALHRLAPEGEAAAIRQQHSAYFVGMAQAAAPHLTGADQEEWLYRLEADHDNMRLILRQALDAANATAALGLSTALWRFWYMRGQYSEGRRWLFAALDLMADDSLRAAALHGAGLLCYCQGDYVQAEAALSEAVSLARTQAATSLLSAALNARGMIVQMQGRYDAAVTDFEEGLVLARETDARREIANILCNLAWVREKQAEFDKASALYNESRAIYQELGDAYAAANTDLNIGWLAFRQRRTDAARRATETALAIFTTMDDGGGMAAAHHNLAWVTLADGDTAQAAMLYRQSLCRFIELGDQKSVAECLVGLGIAAARDGQPTEAVGLWACADHILHSIASPVDPGIHERQATAVALVKSQITETEWCSAWQAGETLAPSTL